MVNKFFPVTNDSNFDGKLSRQQANTFVILAENMKIPVSADTIGRLALLSEAPLSAAAGNIGSGVSVSVTPGIVNAPATTYNLGDGSAIQGPDITSIAMLRQLLPQLIAFETMGIQPMKSASALAFACKWVNAEGKAWFNPANPLAITSASNPDYADAVAAQAAAQTAYNSAKATQLASQGAYDTAYAAQVAAQNAYNAALAAEATALAAKNAAEAAMNAAETAMDNAIAAQVITAADLVDAQDAQDAAQTAYDDAVLGGDQPTIDAALIVLNAAIAATAQAELADNAAQDLVTTTTNAYNDAVDAYDAAVDAYDTAQDNTASANTTLGTATSATASALSTLNTDIAASAAALITLNAAKTTTGNFGSNSLSTRSAEVAGNYEQQTVAARWYRIQAAARSRLYKTEVTEEVVTDINNATGFSTVKDIAKAMADVAAWNINREAIDLMKRAAIPIETEISLSTFTSEEYHKFFYDLRQAAQQIARDTGGVIGNFAIVSPKVGSYIWSYVEGINIRFLDYNTLPLEGVHAYLCTLADGMKIFVDHAATTDYALVGAKGRNEADAGIFFLPYQLSNRINIVPTADATTFMIGVPARYAFIQNPFASGLDNPLNEDSLLDGTNRFYRIFTNIVDLPSLA